MQRKIPAVFMRGGTSRGLFFRKNHLPVDPKLRDQVLLAAYGSPDPNKRQVDGVGGGIPTASKAAIISVSQDPRYDVVYNFAQVSIDRPIVDTKGNCGNISSAVGPYAVDEGLVEVVEPVTRVRIHQLNTNKLIIAEVPVKNGRFDESGDFSISGVPFTGSKITLRFVDPGGSLTGRLLPTGNVRDRLSEIPGVGEVEATVMDASNPCVFVRAEEIGLQGTEIDGIGENPEIKARLEAVRAQTAVLLGFTKSPEDATAFCQAVPKVGCVAPAQDYVDLSGRKVAAGEMDICGRMMSMGTLHSSFPVSGSISVGGAAKIDGTVVHGCLNNSGSLLEDIRVGHPGGVLQVGSKMEKTDNGWHYAEARIYRTARRIMEGHVLVPEHCFS